MDFSKPGLPPLGTFPFPVFFPVFHSPFLKPCNAKPRHYWVFPAFHGFPGFLNRIWPLLFLQGGTQARSGSWPALWRFGFSLAFCIQLDTFGKMNVLVQSPFPRRTHERKRIQTL
jgi:hypothetical protein